ncbi:MAG: DUF420 domain-containing protein [Myxococcota bacterium]
MTTRDLPALNAVLNFTAFVLLILGRRFIRGGERQRHKNTMLSALAVSSAFLASYLTYHALWGSTHFPQSLPGLRLVYLAILLSHTVLAVLNLPVIVLTLLRALQGRFDQHQRFARIAWPIWVYVSVTGVVIYLLLYQAAPRLVS